MQQAFVKLGSLSNSIQEDKIKVATKRAELAAEGGVVREPQSNDHLFSPFHLKDIIGSHLCALFLQVGGFSLSINDIPEKPGETEV